MLKTTILYNCTPCYLQNNIYCDKLILVSVKVSVHKVNTIFLFIRWAVMKFRSYQAFHTLAIQNSVGL